MFIVYSLVHHLVLNHEVLGVEVMTTEAATHVAHRIGHHLWSSAHFASFIDLTGVLDKVLQNLKALGRSGQHVECSDVLIHVLFKTFFVFLSKLINNSKLVNYAGEPSCETGIRSYRLRVFKDIY